jgi:hypothetical protein
VPRAKRDGGDDDPAFLAEAFLEERDALEAALAVAAAVVDATALPR